MVDTHDDNDLTSARDALAGHGRAATAEWTGLASSAASVALEQNTRDALALADAAAACPAALRAFAGELRAAQQQYTEACRQLTAGQALIDGAGGGAPAAADAARDQGAAAVRDATAAMTAARERVRVANGIAAGQIDAASAPLSGIAGAAPGPTPASAGGSGVAATLGNVFASVGNAALHDPLAVGAVAAGGVMVAAGAAGFAGGLAADATGVGTVVGLPMGAGSVALMGAGAGIAGAGLADIGLHAATDRWVQPFRTDIKTSDEDPGPGAPAAARIPNVGVPGRTDGVREVPDDESVRDLFEQLAEDGTPVEQENYPGTVIRAPDGTMLRLRETSKSGGPTIDATLPDNTIWKVHRP